MLYFLTDGINEKQLEAYTVDRLRSNMIDELGWYITDLGTKQLIDEINKHYECSDWSFVARSRKDAAEVLNDWGFSNAEIKHLFEEKIVKN